MENHIKRPPSVWVTQILVLIWTLALLSAWSFSVISTIKSLGYYGVSSRQFMFPIAKFFAMTFAAISPFLILGIVASWGLVRRKRFGRWTAVGLMTLLLLSFVIGDIFQPSGPMAYYEYANSRQAVAGALTAITICGLSLFLIYRLAFGSAANAFFAKPDPENFE